MDQNLSSEEVIGSALKKAFPDATFELYDQSAAHAGHAAAKAHGGGHFALHIQSAEFEGKSRMECHKLVYAALDDLLQANYIHAISIKAEAL